MYMQETNVSNYAGTIGMLTVQGRLALAADALVAAAETGNEQRRKRLSERAMNYLRSVVQE
jgi:hypothetical protein